MRKPPIDTEEEYDIGNLIQMLFWSRIRTALYKKICLNKGSQGFYQWEFLMGRLTRDNRGDKLQFSSETQQILESSIDYLNSTEGRDELLELGITEPPEHMDDLVSQVQGAYTDREAKAEVFRLFMKNKSRLLSYLNRFYG